MRFRDKVEIVATCAVVPCLLELAPASRVLRWLGRVPPRGRPAAPPARLAAHVDRILARGPWIWRYTCLRRAAVLTVLLRREGLDAEVVIGARRVAGALEAHAWVRWGAEEEGRGDGEFVELVRGQGA